jgi:hypothetical protein
MLNTLPDMQERSRIVEYADCRQGDWQWIPPALPVRGWILFDKVRYISYSKLSIPGRFALQRSSLTVYQSHRSNSRGLTRMVACSCRRPWFQRYDDSSVGNPHQVIR